MKFTNTVSICFAGLLAWAITMSANGGILTVNPYKSIVSRNIFDLNVAPIPQQPVQPPLPVAKISLFGLTTILGPPCALFKVSNPSEPDKPGKSCILGEGQIEDDVQVMSIDTKEYIVVFKNHGVVQKISLGNGEMRAPEPKAPPIQVRNIF